MVFIFIEGEARQVEANFRDDRLLHSDVVIRGSMTEWRPGPLWKVQGYFTVSVEIEAAEPIENIEVALVSGRQGAVSYARIPLYSAERFVGKRQLMSFDVGGDDPQAQIVLQFGKKGDPKSREIEVKDLWAGRPNKSVDVTPTAVTPTADAPGAPSAGVHHH